MFARACAACITALLISSGPAAGQGTPAGPASPSAKAAVLGAIVGAAAGFASGMAIGLAGFDDSVNSERKIWLLTGTLTAGGAAAGYWVGRMAARSSPTRRGPLVAPRVAREAVLPEGSVSLRRTRTVPAPPFRTLFEPAGGWAGASRRPVVPVAGGYFRSE